MNKKMVMTNCGGGDGPKKGQEDLEDISATEGLPEVPAIAQTPEAKPTAYFHADCYRSHNRLKKSFNFQPNIEVLIMPRKTKIGTTIYTKELEIIADCPSFNKKGVLTINLKEPLGELRSYSLNDSYDSTSKLEKDFGKLDRKIKRAHNKGGILAFKFKRINY